MRTHTKLFLGAAVLGLSLSVAFATGTCEAAKKKKVKGKTYNYLETKVACDTKYKISEFYGVHITAKNKLKKNMGKANVKWSCSSKNVKLTKKSFTVKKTGSYKLIGKSKKKKFVVPIVAYEKELKYDVSQTKSIKLKYTGNTVTVDNPDEVSWMLTLLNGTKLYFLDQRANNLYTGCPIQATMCNAEGTSLLQFNAAGTGILSGFYGGDCHAGLAPYMETLWNKYCEKSR